MDVEILPPPPDKQPSTPWSQLSNALMILGGVPFAAFVINQVAEASGYGDLAVFTWLIEFSKLPPDHLKNLFAIPGIIFVAGAIMGFFGHKPTLFR